MTSLSIIDGIKKYQFNITDLSQKSHRKSRALNYNIAVYLDENYNYVEVINGLKRELYRHQKTAVQALYDLEQTRNITVNTSCGPAKLVYNAAVLSEPTGSGKTYDILGLIKLSKRPRAIADIMELKSYDNTLYKGYVRCKFKKFFETTIVFAGVITQWEEAVKTFTDMKVFTVKTVKELKQLLNMIEQGSVNDYDVILVRNAKITVPITLPFGIELEDKNRVGQPYMYNIIANIREYCWYRVVIDDLDTIHLPSNAGIVRGIFTWLVSSTRKEMEIRNVSGKNYTRASEFLKNYDYSCGALMSNKISFNVLNVRNDINYLKSVAIMPIPKFHVVVFNNSNDRYIELLNSMKDDDAGRVAEMLNGDAIGEAADAVGVKSNQVVVVFKKILGDKFEKYRFAGDLLSFIEYQESEEDNRKPMKDNPDPNDTYGKRDLLEFREIEYKYPGVKNILADTKEEYKAIRKASEGAIERVKDNITHGMCPYCHTQLGRNDSVITGCCGQVFCGKCGLEAQGLINNPNGKCSNCRRTITIKNLIYISDKFSLENIMQENFDDEIIENEGPENRSKPYSKFVALIDIIYGRPVTGDIRVDMHISNMLKGAKHLPEAKIRKVLIFANYTETLKSIVSELEESKIKYWCLQGGISEIHKISKAFTDYQGTCAMVINSTHHCSGLNLQTATDLVFTHRMIDKNVETQVAGRGHRLGRTNPLNIWYLAYENEVQFLNRENNLRRLTEVELQQELEMERGIKHEALEQVAEGLIGELDGELVESDAESDDE